MRPQKLFNLHASSPSARTSGTRGDKGTDHRSRVCGRRNRASWNATKVYQSHGPVEGRRLGPSYSSNIQLIPDLSAHRLPLLTLLRRLPFQHTTIPLPYPSTSHPPPSSPFLPTLLSHFTLLTSLYRNSFILPTFHSPISVPSPLLSPATSSFLHSIPAPSPSAPLASLSWPLSPSLATLDALSPSPFIFLSRFLPRRPSPSPSPSSRPCGHLQDVRRICL